MKYSIFNTPIMLTLLAVFTTTSSFASDTEQMVSIHFKKASVNQVVDLYRNLTGKIPLLSSAIPKSTTITIETKVNLTHQEGIDAIRTILDMHDILLVDHGDKFVKIVPKHTKDLKFVNRFEELEGEILELSKNYQSLKKELHESHRRLSAMITDSGQRNQANKELESTPRSGAPQL